MPRLSLLLAALLAIASLPAWAGSMTTEEIIHNLSNKTFTGITRKMMAPDAGPSIDLTINFELDSAELTPEGEVLASNLGRALTDPRLDGFRFRIEGHTDATGALDYNQRLSEARARTVKNFVIEKFKVDETRLETIGYGETRLADPAHPDDAINRRVRVTNLGK